jgi:hypothetical protein
MTASLEDDDMAEPISLANHDAMVLQARGQALHLTAGAHDQHCVLFLLLCSLVGPMDQADSLKTTGYLGI